MLSGGDNCNEKLLVHLQTANELGLYFEETISSFFANLFIPGSRESQEVLKTEMIVLGTC